MAVRQTVLVIEPAGLRLGAQLRELWEYRELLYFLAWRDLKVRYKQTFIGAAWAILQPLLAMIVFSIFFGYLAKVPSDGIPYPVFAYSALLPWSLFAHALIESSNSLINNQKLIKKVYFPRLIIPIAPLVVGLVDFVLACSVLLALMLFYGIVPGLSLLAVPLFVLLAMMTALSVALWLSALNVQYRDVRYTIPFLAQLWLFATPVAYPSSLLPEPWRTVYGVNPMAGAVEGFRWALLGEGNMPGSLIAVSILAMLALLIGGFWYFTRMERSFPDHV